MQWKMTQTLNKLYIQINQLNSPINPPPSMAAGAGKFRNPTVVKVVVAIDM